MDPEVWWIAPVGNGRIGIMARPRGGDWLADDLAALKQAGVKIVVSLLESHEVEEFDLGDEQIMAEAIGLEFIRLPIADRGVPEVQAAVRLTSELIDSVAQGSNVVIHCRQGLGRAPLIAAAVLVSSNIDADEAFRMISTARGTEVPETEEQKMWVRSLGLTLQKRHS